ncbi:MAG: relaxase/mobilization nuclease domain-containing protein [Bosea sp. (in: a-proteobacteria)]
MIGRSIIGSSFDRLIAYVTRSMAALDNLSVQVDNLLSIKTAATEMRRFAAGAKRCNRPAWHLIFAWHPDEFDPSLPVTEIQDRIMEASRAVLCELGLRDHQAVFSAHHDQKEGLVPGQRHWEVHVVVNRVGPDRKVISASWDFAKVEAGVAIVADRMGLRQVPGRFNGVADTSEFVANRTGDRAREEHDRSGQETVEDALRNDACLMTELRRCRSAGDAAGFFRTLNASGYGVHWHPARNARLAPGIVVYELNKPARCCAFSTLDTRSEKWGQGALEKSFGAAALRIHVQPAATVHAAPSRRVQTTPKIAATRKDTASWEEFKSERDLIKSENARVWTERSARIAEIRRGFNKRWRAAEKHARDSEISLRRTGTYAWPIALILHLVTISITRHLLQNARHSAEAAIAAAETTYASFRQEVPSWTAWKRAAEHRAKAAVDRAAREERERVQREAEARAAQARLEAEKDERMKREAEERRLQHLARRTAEAKADEFRQAAKRDGQKTSALWRGNRAVATDAMPRFSNVVEITLTGVEHEQRSSIPAPEQVITHDWLRRQIKEDSAADAAEVKHPAKKAEATTSAGYPARAPIVPASEAGALQKSIVTDARVRDERRASTIDHVRATQPSSAGSTPAPVKQSAPIPQAVKQSSAKVPTSSPFTTKPSSERPTELRRAPDFRPQVGEAYLTTPVPAPPAPALIDSNSATTEPAFDSLRDSKAAQASDKAVTRRAYPFESITTNRSPGAPNATQEAREIGAKSEPAPAKREAPSGPVHSPDGSQEKHLKALLRFQSILDAEITHAMFYRRYKGLSASERMTEAMEAEKVVIRSRVVGPAPQIDKDGNPLVFGDAKMAAARENFDRAQTVIDLGDQFNKETGKLVQMHEPALKVYLTDESSKRIHSALTGGLFTKLSLHERFCLLNINALDDFGTRQSINPQQKGVLFLTVKALRETVQKMPEKAHVAVRALEASIGETRRALGNQARDNNKRQEMMKARNARGRAD